jgi:hypothetical protein
MSKRIVAKAYSPSGSLLRVWDGFRVDGFTLSLDGGLGECVVDLAAAYGDAGEDFAEGNRVDLVVCDAETLAAASTEPGGASLLYRGRITRVVRGPRTGNGEVSVSLIGEQSRLAMDVLANGSQTTLYSNAATGLTVTSGSFSAADVGLMARAVVDRHIAENAGTPIHYLDGDIPDVGVTAKYLFEAMMVRDALDELKGMAAGLHWYADATGRVRFGFAPTVPTHTLTFGRQIVNRPRIERSIEQVRNVWYIWDGQAGGLYKRYQDAASIAKYGRRSDPPYVDSSIRDAAAMDAIGARKLAETKDPKVALTVEVVDSNSDANGYDIETLLPGGTVRLVGFDQDVADWTFNDSMIITEVRWTPGKAYLTVDASPVGIVPAHRELAYDVAAMDSRGVPATFT